MSNPENTKTVVKKPQAKKAAPKPEPEKRVRITFGAYVEGELFVDKDETATPMEQVQKALGAIKTKKLKLDQPFLDEQVIINSVSEVTDNG